MHAEHLMAVASVMGIVLPLSEAQLRILCGCEEQEAKSGEH